MITPKVNKKNLLADKMLIFSTILIEIIFLRLAPRIEQGESIRSNSGIISDAI